MKKLREEEELKKLAIKKAIVSEQNNNNLFRDSKIFGKFFDPKNYTEASFNKSNIFGDFFDPANYGNADKEGFTPNYNLFINEPNTKQKEIEELTNQKTQSGVPYGQPGSWTQGMGAAPYSPPAPQQGPVVAGQNPVTYKNMSDEDFARTYQQQRELMQPTVGTGVGDAIVDAGKYLYQNSIFGETNGMGPSQWADSEISRQEDERAYNTPEAINARRVAAEREAATKAEKQRMSLMGDAMSGYEPRPTPSLMDEQGRGGPAYPSVPYQGLPFEGGPKTPEQMMYDGYNPDIKKQMDAQRAANAQVELEAYNAQINNPTADDIAPVSFVPKEVTSTTVIESVDAAVEVLTAGDPETNDEYVKRTLNGETNLGKFLDFIGLIGEETEEVDEATADVVLSDLATIAGTTEATTEVEQSGLLVGETTSSDYVKQPTTSDVDGLFTNGNTGGATHTMPDGTVHTGATHTASSVPVNNSTSTASAVTTPSLMNTTVDSTAGFTMDRFKNPLSAENKAWWLGGGGGVPGNNRAKEFFDTLAYIGTPLKYRPSKTPSQQGMENRIANNNNMMDYASSMASANKSTAPSFASLRAGLPSYTQIKDSVAGSMTSEFEGSKLFGGMSKEDKVLLDSEISAAATAVQQRMVEMTLTTGTPPNMQDVIKTMIKEQDAKNAEIERLKEEEKARIEALKPTTEGSSWWSDLLNN